MENNSMKLCDEVAKLIKDCKKANLRCFVVNSKHNFGTIAYFFVSDGKNVLYIESPTCGNYFSWKVSFKYPIQHGWGDGCSVFDSFYDGWKEFNAEVVKSFMHTPNFPSYPVYSGTTPRLYNDVEEFIASEKKFWGNQFVEL